MLTRVGVRDHGVVNSDAVLAVAAGQGLGAVRSDRWPMVAAHLLAVGLDGADLVALASLSANASGWEIDQLVPGALAEMGAPELTVQAASDVYARLVAMASWDRQEYPIVLTLARLAPELDYPDGVVSDAYYASEWVSCDCCADSQARADADALEARLAALPALDLPAGLVEALMG
ncbi:MAG TPA: hypothetical protein VGJ45_15735 [Pseudonocardiaceae bacterium]